MKLKSLSTILYSSHGSIQSAIVYDLSANKDLEHGCSIEYAVKHYGDSEVKRIQADDDYLVITI